MKRIEFDEIYRPDIESGEYKVETRDGRSIRIVAWDRRDSNDRCHPILGLAYNSEIDCEEVVVCNSKGKASGPDKDDLFITWEMPEISEFQRVYLEKVHHVTPNDIQPKFLTISKVIENCDALMAAAEKDIAKKFNGNYAWLKGREQACENMKVPMWKQVEANYEYPTCLTREMDVNGDWQYCISSGKIYDGCQYISLAELGLLPIKEEDKQV